MGASGVGSNSMKSTKVKSYNAKSKNIINNKNNMPLVDEKDNFNDVSKQLLTALSKIRRKNIPKQEKEKEITFIINNCFYQSNKQNQILLKKIVLECLHFCLKYGNDSQRCRIQELFEINLEIFLTSPRAKFFLIYLFKYAKASRREFLVKIISNKISRLIITKNLGKTINEIFTDYLTTKQKYTIIEDLFGKHYSIFQVNNPGKTLLEYAQDSIFISGIEDIKKNIVLFASKSIIHTSIIHYFLLKTHQISPKDFHIHLLPTIFDTCFDIVIDEKVDDTTNVESFCSTHYGCELVARIIHYQYSNRNDFQEYRAKFSKVEDILRKNMRQLLKFSGGLALLRTIINMEEYKGILLECLWNPFLEDISSYVENLYGDTQYILNLLETIPPQYPRVNDNSNTYLHNFAVSVSSFSTMRKSENDDSLSICNWVHDDMCDYYCSIIKQKFGQHFVKNSRLILTEFNYGFAFAQWRPILNKKFISQIYNDLITYLNVKYSNINVDSNTQSKHVEDLWFTEKTIPNIVRRIISIENELDSIAPNDTFIYSVLHNIDMETQLSWLSHKNGVNLLLTLVNTAKPCEKLTQLVDYLKKANNHYFNSKI